MPKAFQFALMKKRFELGRIVAHNSNPETRNFFAELGRTRVFALMIEDFSYSLT